VRFDSQSVRHLLSASSDGLLSISDPTEDAEEDAVIYTGDWGCSISQAGWIHPRNNNSGSRIWASSDMETFSTWTPEVVILFSFWMLHLIFIFQLDLVYGIDIREPSVHNQRTTWVTDYFIAGHDSPRSDKFSAFVGSNE
jgi:WD repeat-containing protein 89